MSYHLIHENEEGLAVIADENGVLSLPTVTERPTNVEEGIVNSKLFHDIIYVGALCNVSDLPKNTPHHRINYNELVNDSNRYITTASLLLRFAGSFIR